MDEALVEAWLINNRITLLLLKELSREALECTLSTRGGRTVGQQLAHVNEVRVRRLELAGKARVRGLPAVGRDDGHDGAKLVEAFEASGAAVATLIRDAAADGGRVKGFKRGIVALVGYLISHDAHHRGHALCTLKQARVKRPEILRFGLWEWNKI